MGRSRQITQIAQQRNIRIDYPHDEESKRKVKEFFEGDWVEEVIVCAETNEGGDNPHYHAVGKFKYTTFCLTQMLKETFEVSKDGFYNKAPRESEGGYEGALRYASKGMDMVLNKGLDYKHYHTEFWRINRELKTKAKEKESVKDATLAKFRGRARVDRREVIEFIVNQYVARKKSINDHVVLSLARLVLCSTDESSKAAYITNLVDRML